MSPEALGLEREGQGNRGSSFYIRAMFLHTSVYSGIEEGQESRRGYSGTGTFGTI